MVSLSHTCREHCRWVREDHTIWTTLYSRITGYQPSDKHRARSLYSKLFKYRHAIGYWGYGACVHHNTPELVKRVLRGHTGCNRVSRGRVVQVTVEQEHYIIGYQLFPVAIEQSGEELAFRIVRKKIFDIDVDGKCRWASVGITRDDLLLNGIVAQINKEWVADCTVLVEVLSSRDTEKESVCLSRTLKSTKWLVDEEFNAEYSFFEFLSDIRANPKNLGLSNIELSSSIEIVHEHAQFRYFTSVMSYVRNYGGSITENGEIIFEDDSREGGSEYERKHYEEKITMFRIPVTQFVEGQCSIDWEFNVSSLFGLWVGDYNAHGLEFLWFSMTDDKEYCYFLKLTGDPNIPSGTVSILVKTSELLHWNVDAPAMIQISESSYSNPQLAKGFLRVCSPFSIRFLWEQHMIWSSFRKLAH